MPRLPADYRITIKNNNTGRIHKIELIEQPIGYRRYWVRFDGVNSEKMPQANLTEVSHGVRKLLQTM